MKRAVPIAMILGFAMGGSAQSRMRPASAAVVVPARSQMVRVSNSQLNTYPVPGLGFDYTHFAAIHGHRSSHISSGAQRTLTFGAVVPVAIPFLNNIQIVIVQAPPIVILPVPENEEVAPDPPRHSRRRYVEEDTHEAEWERETLRAPASLIVQSPNAPPKDIPELVFIRRDGGLVFAVAYVQRGNHVVYVTREGRRQSLDLLQLDLEATRQMNESLGTTLSFQ